MKKLKFLVDIGVGKKAEKWLLDNGFDSKPVRDINPKAKDSGSGRVRLWIVVFGVFHPFKSPCQEQKYNSLEEQKLGRLEVVKPEEKR
jgi:hypothetical protein